MGLFFKPKKASHDFTVDNLPSNRKEVFFDSLKLRFRDFLKLGLLLLLFSLPLIILNFVKDMMLFNMTESLTIGQITEEEFNGAYTILYLAYYAIEIICLIVLSLGLAGALRVIRQIAWGEPVFFSEDFFEGIKLNKGHFIVYFLFIGIFNMLNRSIMLLNIQYEILKVLPLAFALVILFPPVLYSLAETLIYTNPIFGEYKNGFALYIKTFPTTILATIVVLLPLLFDLIPLLVIKYLIYVVFIIVLFPIILLGEFLYFNSRLDKYINKEMYPEIYDKGIHRKENIKIK